MAQTKKVLEECLQEMIRPIRARRAKLLDDKVTLLIFQQRHASIEKETENGNAMLKNYLVRTSCSLLIGHWC